MWSACHRLFDPRRVSARHRRPTGRFGAWDAGGALALSPSPTSLERMGIWFGEFPVDAVNERNRGTLAQALGIEFVAAGDDFLTGRMPVDARTHQPAHVLHGGASVAFAETLASWGATF